MSEVDKFLAVCDECGVCVSVCGFLQHYCDHSPTEIARVLKRNVLENIDIPYSCSLCGLCQTVCKYNLSAGDMCLEAREAIFETGRKDQLPNDFVYDYLIVKHKAVRNHQILSSSPFFTFTWPKKRPCRTVFFPGCSLSAYSPNLVTKTFDYLRSKIPEIGIMLDCCGKPSQDMGDKTRFEHMSRKVSKTLAKLGIEEIVVACANCRSVFSGNGELGVSTVYEVMSREGLPGNAQNSSLWTQFASREIPSDSESGAKVPPVPNITIHDSCPARRVPSVRGAVRDIANQMGLHVSEIRFKNEKTQCCGGGGCAPMGNTALADRNTKARAELADSLVVAYCAHCRERLSSYVPSLHILDLVFGTGYKQPTREYRDSWQNWLNRWILKKKLQLKRR